MPCEYFFSYSWNKIIDGKIESGFANSSLQSDSKFEINGIDDMNYAEKLIAKERGYDQVAILFWRKF